MYWIFLKDMFPVHYNPGVSSQAISCTTNNLGFPGWVSWSDVVHVVSAHIKHMWSQWSASQKSGVNLVFLHVLNINMNTSRHPQWSLKSRCFCCFVTKPSAIHQPINPSVPSFDDVCRSPVLELQDLMWKDGSPLLLDIRFCTLL